MSRRRALANRSQPLRRRPAATGRSARAPRVTSFPAARRPLSACDPPRPPLPRAEAPSADESLRAWSKPSALRCWLSPAQVPRPRSLWKPERRDRASETQVLPALRNGGPPLVPRVAKTRAQLPTCIHESARAVPLDLLRRAGFSPERSEPHAAHRLLQSDRPTSTPSELPNPAGECLQSNSPPAALPLAGMSQPISR